MTTSTQTRGLTGTWTIDPTHSLVEFSGKHMMFTTVKGRFADVSGTIVVDEANPAGSSVEVEIATASIDSREEQRDAHLRSPDFLDAESHAEIGFRSTAVEPTGEDTFRIRGELTVKETPFEVELDGRIRGLGRGKAGDERLLIDVRGAFDWGSTSVEITAAVSAVKEA